MKNNFTLDELVSMTERSLLFQVIKAEMEKRCHWRAKSRGIPQSRAVLQRKLTTADIPSPKAQQVSDETAFNEWGA